MSDPYAAVQGYLEGEGVQVSRDQVTEIVQTVIRAIDYSSCIACPNCGAEVDTRTATKL